MFKSESFDFDHLPQDNNVSTAPLQTSKTAENPTQGQARQMLRDNPDVKLLDFYSSLLGSIRDQVQDGVHQREYSGEGEWNLKAWIL